VTDGKPALVALRDRREVVIQTLTDSFANDLIDIDTFEDRTALAHRATTVVSLDELVADLEPMPNAAKRAELIVRVESALDRPARRAVRAIFGSVERRGGWAVPRELAVSTIFGSGLLDFREATFASGVTEVHVRVVFGSLEIIVPPHLAVECEGAGIFGTFEQTATPVADPDRPVLRIVGSAVFGSVDIEMRLPREDGRDAHRRRRDGRKALREAERPLLPPRE
jgi:Cell wall-active antibiotics response 4TMS YvqF/Domain of unknown function (DUF1707)